jgi:hypothetical protein
MYFIISVGQWRKCWKTETYVQFITHCCLRDYSTSPIYETIPFGALRETGCIPSACSIGLTKNLEDMNLQSQSIKLVELLDSNLYKF